MKHFKRAALHTLLISMMGFMLAFPAFAQESTEEPDEPTPIEQVTEDTEGFVGDVIGGLDNLIAPYIAIAIPLVMLLVQFSKGILPDVSADTLKRFWSVALWVVFVILARVGYAQYFNELVPAITTILATLTGVVVTAEGSSLAYNTVSDIPFLGYARTEQPE